MSHDPRQHMGGGHNTILDRLAQHFQDVAPALREFFQTIRSGVLATPCPASTPVHRGSVSPPRPGQHASLAGLSGWVRSGAFQPLCRGGHASWQALGRIIDNLVCGGSQPARVAHSPAAVG
jgi:hypothetical protein